MAPKYAPEGRYFRLKGEECGIYLTAEGGSASAGTPVVIYEEIEPRSDSQIWFEDAVTGTVRCKHGQLCLTLTGENLIVLDHYQPGHDGQKWKFDEDSGMVTSWTGDLVLDVADHNTHGGSPIIAAGPTGEGNQKWSFKRQNNQYFTIVSEFSGLCIEAESKMMGGIKSGAKIVMGPQDQKDNQLWYEDKNGIIRSKVKDFGITCEMEQGAQIQLDEYDESNPAMQWVVLPNKYIATKSLLTNVLDIEGRDERKGAKVIVWQAIDAENQKWNIEYYSKGKKSKKSDGEDSDD